MGIFRNGVRLDDEDLERMGDDASDAGMARAEARMLDSGHHAARRNRNLKRELASPDVAGQWGVSRHRGAGKNWH
jgi:hypothetical protein